MYREDFVYDIPHEFVQSSLRRKILSVSEGIEILQSQIVHLLYVLALELDPLR
jgi:hypothetical protein